MWLWFAAAVAAPQVGDAFPTVEAALPDGTSVPVSGAGDYRVVEAIRSVDW